MTPADATLQPSLIGQPSELEQLGTQLASRQSITWFARCFVCTNASVIVGGAAILLFTQSARLPYLFVPVAALACATVTGAIYSFVRGRSVLARERADFRRLQDLRRAAGFDV